jgi:hypothetical protein
MCSLMEQEMNIRIQHVEPPGDEPGELPFIENLEMAVTGPSHSQFDIDSMMIQLANQAGTYVAGRLQNQADC